jgi:L-ribulose-5-phosphate 3-epimerase UlaE
MGLAATVREAQAVAAAALRAAADQVVPDIGYEADWHEPVAQELQYVRNRLLAIAAELEGGK